MAGRQARDRRRRSPKRKTGLPLGEGLESKEGNTSGAGGQGRNRMRSPKRKTGLSSGQRLESAEQNTSVAGGQARKRVRSPKRKTGLPLGERSESTEENTTVAGAREREKRRTVLPLLEGLDFEENPSKSPARLHKSRERKRMQETRKRVSLATAA